MPQASTAFTAKPKKRKEEAVAAPKVHSKDAREPLKVRTGADDASPTSAHSGGDDQKSKALILTVAPDLDRAWKIAQLAANLVSKLDLYERAPLGLKVNPQLTTKELDPVFAAALKRADSLLSWAEGQSGVVLRLPDL